MHLTDDDRTRTYATALLLAAEYRPRNQWAAKAALKFATWLRTMDRLKPHRIEAELERALRTVSTNRQPSGPDDAMIDAYLCLNPDGRTIRQMIAILRLAGILRNKGQITSLRTRALALAERKLPHGKVGIGPALHIDPSTGQTYFETAACQGAKDENGNPCPHSETVFYIFHAHVWARIRYRDILQASGYSSCPVTKTLTDKIVAPRHGIENYHLELGCEYLTDNNSWYSERQMPMPLAHKPQAVMPSYIGAAMIEACTAAAVPLPASVNAKRANPDRTRPGPKPKPHRYGMPAAERPAYDPAVNAELIDGIDAITADI